jgi:hypothetical protein
LREEKCVSSEWSGCTTTYRKLYEDIWEDLGINSINTEIKIWIEISRTFGKEVIIPKREAGLST